MSKPPTTAKPLVVAGSYDGGLVGWEAQSDGALKLVFAYTSHEGSVRSLDIIQGGQKAGAILASGGIDEVIRLYDTAKRVEIGELRQHSGTITCLTFVGSSHLLSASGKGDICIWRVHDWQLLHILNEHKGAVRGLAVHPTGKLALSVGADRRLRIWDLVKGKCAFVKKLQDEPENVLWSFSGNSYALLFPNLVEVHSTASNSLIFQKQTSTTTSRFVCMTFLDEQTIVLATQDNNLQVIPIEKPGEKEGRAEETVLKVEGGGRIKSIGVLSSTRVVVALSGGVCETWDVKEGECKGKGNMGEAVRITCMAAWGGRREEGAMGAKEKKRKVDVVEKQENENKKKKSVAPAQAAVKNLKQNQPDVKVLKKRNKEKSKEGFTKQEGEKNQKKGGKGGDLEVLKAEGNKQGNGKQSHGLKDTGSNKSASSKDEVKKGEAGMKFTIGKVKPKAIVNKNSIRQKQKGQKGKKF